jgi:endonuclease YncB( thermonuclease family)
MPSTPRFSFAFALGCATLATLSVTAWSATTLQQPLNAPPQRCKVLAITDGDTLLCDINGDGIGQKATEKIRLLQVDTPEIHHSHRNPTGQPQPFGPQAAAFTTAELLGKVVRLQTDKRPNDRYGRVLALVYREDLPANQTEVVYSLTQGKVSQRTVPSRQVSHNQRLLAKGLATTMIISPNKTNAEAFKAIERYAAQQRLGLWANANLLPSEDTPLAEPKRGKNHTPPTQP